MGTEPADYYKREFLVNLDLHIFWIQVRLSLEPVSKKYANPGQPVLNVSIQLMPYSDSTRPHLPIRPFLKKWSRHVLIGWMIILFSLGIGMWGYHDLEKMAWVDAYLNAAMILSGMGPVSNLQTEAGKIFAGTYALFSGIVFLVVIAFVFAPVIRRFFHKFHLDQSEKK